MRDVRKTGYQKETELQAEKNTVRTQGDRFGRIGRESEKEAQKRGETDR